MFVAHLQCCCGVWVHTPGYPSLQAPAVFTQGCTMAVTIVSSSLAVQGSDGGNSLPLLFKSAWSWKKKYPSE